MKVGVYPEWTSETFCEYGVWNVTLGGPSLRPRSRLDKEWEKLARMVITEEFGAKESEVVDGAFVSPRGDFDRVRVFMKVDISDMEVIESVGKTLRRTFPKKVYKVGNV